MKNNKILIKVIICIIAIILIGIVFINTNANDIREIEEKLQINYKDSILYSSNNKIILEMYHLEEADAAKLDFSKIFQPLKDNVNTKLSKYDELIILLYVDVEENKNTEIIRMDYSIPELKEISVKTYIDQDYLQSSITDAMTNIFKNY